ncbi:hypothetical protein D1007_14659 [Hordeum vulgare]|nr:hypothetical protein D1007_14659 [Hordeum vulgare]
MLWILFTLADSLLDLIMGSAVDAYTAWTRVRDYFQANQGAQYLHLTRQLRTLKQGDLPVSDYARRLKALADGLADTGHPVSYHDLTMQLLHGLDARLDTIRTLLGDAVPLPSFAATRSRLDLAEYNINLRAAEAGPAALTISGGPGSSQDRGDRAAHTMTQRHGFDPGEFRSQGILVFLVDPEAVAHPKNLQERATVDEGGQVFDGEVNVVELEGTQLQQNDSYLHNAAEDEVTAGNQPKARQQWRSANNSAMFS